MSRKTIRKLYRITPLNEEIKRIEMDIYKEETYNGAKVGELTRAYLSGLKTAKLLVMGKMDGQK